MKGGFTGIAISFVLALLAGLANAAGQVLQRKAARKEPAELQMSPRLLVDLAQRRTWLFGICAVVGGTLFQIAALAFGPLATVQTIVILELPFTLIGAYWFLGSKLRGRDWISIVVMTAGAAGVVGFLNPRGGHAQNIGTLTWALAAGATTLPIVVLYLLARRSEGSREAALLGAATGICFALFAGLMKGVTLQFHHGLLAVLASWQIYVGILTAVAGMWLLQNALHAGKLAAAQPGITLLDPAVAIVWGALVFHEHMRGGVFIALAFVSGALVAGAAIALAESPLFNDENENANNGDDVDDSG